MPDIDITTIVIFVVILLGCAAGLWVFKYYHLLKNMTGIL